jgi:hypothetical protein
VSSVNPCVIGRIPCVNDNPLKNNNVYSSQNESLYQCNETSQRGIRIFEELKESSIPKISKSLVLIGIASFIGPNLQIFIGIVIGDEIS